MERYAIGIEDIEPDHWVAWIFAFPGRFGSGRTEAEALAAVPVAIARELALAAEHGIEVDVTERWRAFPAADEPDYLVNAFFDDDARPLTEGEISAGLGRLAASRAALLRLLAAEPLPGEVIEIARHIANVEWWYLDRLGLAPRRADAPGDLGHDLTWARDALTAVLPRLAGDTIGSERVGERWSPRKVLRRAIWHERDHVEQIAALSSMRRDH